MFEKMSLREPSQNQTREASNETMQPSIKDINSALRARIWTAAQKSLFDPSVARKLRLFDFSSSKVQTHQEREIILDSDSPPRLVNELWSPSVHGDEHLLLTSDVDPDDLLDDICLSEESSGELLLDFESDPFLQEYDDDEGDHGHGYDNARDIRLDLEVTDYSLIPYDGLGEPQPSDPRGPHSDTDTSSMLDGCSSSMEEYPEEQRRFGLAESTSSGHGEVTFRARP